MGSEVSTLGDIYSFGVLLLEMFTGKTPTNDMFRDSLTLHNFVERALPEQVMEITDPSLLQEMQLNSHVTSERSNNLKERYKEWLISIFEIGISCSVETPQERLKISDVVAQLSSIRSKLLGIRRRR